MPPAKAVHFHAARLLPAALAALLLSACAGLQPPAQATPDPGAVAALDGFVRNQCNPVVARTLAGARIPIAQVKDVTYGLYPDLDSDRILMYDAWVSLKDQPGNVVVQLDEYCYPRQIYTRGGAILPQPASR